MADPSLRSEPPPALAPPPGNRRFPLLDGLRAVAALCVLVVHVAVASPPGSDTAMRLLFHLNVGVAVFFLISGFVLYRPFISHRAGGPAPPGFGVYAKRRFLRIFPAYWLVLTVLTLLPGTTGVSGGDWFSQYALLHTIEGIGGRDCLTQVQSCGLAQTWSLVVELTFYAALPLYVLFAERLARGRRPGSWLRLETVALAALGVGGAVIHFGFPGAGVTTRLDSTLAVYMVWFGLGMWLAVVSVWLDTVEHRPRAVSLVARFPTALWVLAIAAYVGLCLSIPPTLYFLTLGEELAAYLVFALVALLLILPAVLGDEGGGAPRRLLATPVMAWLGLISYGIFLWHYVVTIELGLPGEGLDFWPLLAATLAISIACATVSYYALERPVLKFKNRR